MEKKWKDEIPEVREVREKVDGCNVEYEQVSSHTNADIVVECKECKRLNKIIFAGIAGILNTKPA